MKAEFEPNNRDVVLTIFRLTMVFTVVFALGAGFGMVLLDIYTREQINIVKETESVKKIPLPEPSPVLPTPALAASELQGYDQRVPESIGSTEKEKSVEDKRMTDLLKKTESLQDELETIKTKRSKDHQIIEELVKLNQRNDIKIRKIMQPPPVRKALNPVPVTKAVLPLEIDDLKSGLDAFNKGNYDTAIDLLKPLADRGDSAAQFHMAVMYRNGQGILANNNTALEWMLKSARQGYEKAQIELARLYSNGINGIQDHFLAYTWYLVAEKNGVYVYIDERTDIEHQLQKEMIPQAAALAAQLKKDGLMASVKEAATGE